MKIIRLILSIVLLAVGISTSAAAGKTLDEQFPLDSAVRYGVLPNGLTYYILHNEEPKNRAEFHIAQKVGSILEEENQRGLAHFLEHMAFNGTEHFPGKSMLEYLQDNGMRFGSDINAYTGFDETVYRVSNVPTQRESLLDSTLLVLYDWACGISLDAEEIDKERGVIREEWRSRGNATQRMYDAVLPIIFHDSRYADRMPIGTMEVVMNFKPEELRDYYHRWYRPDQQGLIIVGDFDADRVEQKVIEMFGKIKMPENAPERVYFQVPDHKGIDYASYADPEASMTLVYLFFQHEATPFSQKNTRGYLKKELTGMLSSVMLASRFAELAQKPDAPFNYAVGQDGQFFITPTKDAYMLIASAKDGMTMETFKTILTEAQRLNLHGFTAGELERAKADVRLQIEHTYAERNKLRSNSLAESLITHFTQGGYWPGIEIETHESLELLPEITLEDVSEFVENAISEDNVSLIISGQEKEGVTYPTKEEIEKAFNEVLSSSVDAYVDNTPDEPLIPNEPVAGSIVEEAYDDELGITVWKLSNGATVYLKPTDFKNNEINMNAVSIGGEWAYGGETSPELKLLNDVIDNSTVGSFTRTDLGKRLAGKGVNVDFNLYSATEAMTGICVKKDIETMFQLNYLMFTEVNKDEQAVDALCSRLSSQLALRDKNPSYIFRDSVMATLYSHNPLYEYVTEEDLREFNYDKCLALYRERMANAGDFTFSFVGNFDVDSLRPLVEKYVASLPDNGKREKVSYTVSCVDGILDNRFKLPMLTPKTIVLSNFSGQNEYSVHDALMFNLLSNVMDIVYTATIREEEGGTYGVGVNGDLSQFTDEWSFTFQFSTNAEQMESLLQRANDELQNVITNGAEEAEFNKVKLAAIKQYENSVRTNGYWLSVLNDKALGVDSYAGFREMLENVTLEEFNAFIKKLDFTKNRVTVVMEGVEK